MPSIARNNLMPRPNNPIASGSRAPVLQQTARAEGGPNLGGGFKPRPPSGDTFDPKPSVPDWAKYKVDREAIPRSDFANRPDVRLPAIHEMLDTMLTSSGQVGRSPQETGSISSAAELAQFAYAGYNGGALGPVSIVKATITEGAKTSPAYLVGISGTEPVTGQSTGWKTNIKAAFEANNPGLRNAKEAIFRSIPEGADLVLTGHSQGGMIAQQLAADPEIKAKYNVINTVAFGSPLISAGRREGEVHRIAAALDPVPFLSAESAAMPPWAILGAQWIPTNAGLNGIKGHSSNYTDEGNKELAKMDALGRKNPKTPATISFDTNERLFFTSPTKTQAGKTDVPEVLYTPDV